MEKKKVLTVKEGAFSEGIFNTLHRPKTGEYKILDTYFPGGYVILDGDITLGEHTKVWEFSKLIGTVVVGNNCMVASYCLLKGLAGPVVIGSGTRIQDYCFFDGPTTIGKNCFIGARVQVGNDKFPMSDKNKGAVIGDNCIIGNCVNIIPDTVIGDNVIIGASGLVTKDVKDNVFMVGKDKIVGTRDDYERKKAEWLEKKHD